MKLLEDLIDKLGLQHKQQEPRSFSQDDARRTFLAAEGNRLFNDLDKFNQKEISEVFAGHDVNGLKHLIATYDAATVEAFACALDDAAKAVIGEDTSYHGWATETMRGELDTQAPTP